MSAITEKRTASVRYTIARLAFIKTEILKATVLPSHHATVLPSHHANAVTISKEIECCPRTIRRDIDFLRDRLGHNLEFDPVRNSWIYLSAPSPVL